jgi:hypothetical protein
MLLVLEILGGWVTLAVIVSAMERRRARRMTSAYLTDQENDIVQEACRDWFKTGVIADRYIDDLEAQGIRKPGFWRELARRR